MTVCSLVPDLSEPSLVQARLHLPFTQPIATAMVLFGASLRLTPAGLARNTAPGGIVVPGRRPTAPVRRDHLGYWVESTTGAVTTGRGESLLPAAFTLRRCLNPDHSPVSSRRSSHRTCGSPASGARTRCHAVAHGGSRVRTNNRCSPKTSQNGLPGNRAAPLTQLRMLPA